MRCIYAIYDKVAQVYKDPCTLINDASAIRALSNLVNHSESEFSFSPSDFDLIKLAEWDEFTGVITPVAPAPVIANGGSLRKVVGDE